MKTSETPMLSCDTDISDDDMEMNGNIDKAKGSGYSDPTNSGDDGLSTNTFDTPVSAGLNTLISNPCGRVLNEIKNRTKLGIDMPKERESSSSEAKTIPSEFPAKVLHVESSTTAEKDTNSRERSCGTPSENEDQDQCDSRKNVQDSTTSLREDISKRNVTSFPDIVVESHNIPASNSLLSVSTKSTDSESSMKIEKNESFSTPRAARSSTNESSRVSKNTSPPHVPTSTTENTNVSTLSVPELLTDTPIQNQVSQQQPPIGILTRRIVSMGPQGNNNQNSPQESYLITVPADSHYLNAQNFARSGINTNGTVAQATNSHQHPVTVSSGRRSIRLRLVEDKEFSNGSRRSFVKSILKGSRSKSLKALDEDNGYNSGDEMMTDLGTVLVSWYQGTTSMELQDHVHNSVFRKLGKKVDDIRLLDESVIPHEEIVLSPYIPDGSRFMVKFKIRPPTPTKTVYHYASEAPHSPSRAPTPYGSESDLSTINIKLNDEDMPRIPNLSKKNKKKAKEDKTNATKDGTPISEKTHEENNDDDENKQESRERIKKSKLKQRNKEAKIISQKTVINGKESLEKIIYLPATRRDEKKHVIFVLANYFVLFLSIIAISAEIHERGPDWIHWVEENVDRVNACAVDRDSLFECISNGDISGLLASIVLWMARNNTLTTRFFLFGFDSVQKLWTVVYEALVTAICWGTSYIFIRRGLNPDTRANFLEKYWKDAIYGSLAGFNAAFLKAVLKNLIPKEVLEEIVDNNRQLRIIEIFARAFANKN